LPLTSLSSPPLRQAEGEGGMGEVSKYSFPSRKIQCSPHSFRNAVSINVFIVCVYFHRIKGQTHSGIMRRRR